MAWESTGTRRASGRVISAAVAFFAFLSAPLHAGDKPGADPVLEVYTAYIPPYAAPTPEGGIEGTLTSDVEAFLEDHHIAHNTILLPWSAAYRRTLASPTALLFPIDRTPAREDKFIWVKPLLTTSYYIYALRTKVPEGTTLDDIKNNGGIVSCTMNSVQCDLLVQAGFAEDNILRIEGASVQKRFKLMVRERNYYTIFDPNVFEDLKKRYRLDASHLIRLEKIGDKTSYLAANRSIDPAVLARLR